MTSSFVTALKWFGLSILIIIVAFSPFLTYAGFIFYENVNYDLEKNPYTHWAGLEPSSQIYISWETNDETPSNIWLGTDPTNIALIYQNSSITQFHRILITGLIPDTIYYYKAGFNTPAGDAIYIGPLNTFRTAPVSYRPYNFTVISDTQSVFGSGYYDQLARRFGQPDFDTEFLSIVGDLIDIGTFQYEWNRFFKETAPYASKFSLLPTIGNHDGRTEDTLYRKYIGVSHSPDDFYFAFNYSNTLFVSAEYSDFGGMPDDLLKKQISWINETLINGQSMKWRILLVHRVEEWVEPFFDGYNVSLVFCGHYHHYDRYTEKGTPIMQLGSGGSIQDLYYSERNSSQQVLVQPSYTTVAIDDTKIDVKTFSTHDLLLDSFVIGGTI